MFPFKKVLTERQIIYQIYGIYDPKRDSFPFFQESVKEFCS